MLKSLALVSLFAAAAAVAAQSTDAPSAAEQTPAPIVRVYRSSPAPQANPDPEGNPPYPARGRAPMPRRGRRPENSPDQILDSRPISGVWLRSRSTAVLKTIYATPRGTEIRLEHGILNVNVHQPAAHSEILVDLPGGQISLLKDGLYTFNADTNTVRVLYGEAAAYPSQIAPKPTVNARPEKPIKIKESHELAFNPPFSSPGSPVDHGAGPLKADRPQSIEAYPYELAADLLPTGTGDGSAYANVSGLVSGEDGPYGYPYPYYAGAWGYPYGLYPYGFGYEIGVGYYGGFWGRGFHR